MRVWSPAVGFANVVLLFVPLCACDPTLIVVTYMNEASSLFGFLQVSASAHGLYPQILGYGEKAWWPEGLGAKINALAAFVRTVRDTDIVLFVDAFDVMVFAGKEEIVGKFEALEKSRQRSLFFNAERQCFPPFDDICTDDYPASPNSNWRFLNSGVFIGRGGAMLRMLANEVPDSIPGGDQSFYQRYFLTNRDLVGLDTDCSLVCATQGVGESFGLELQDGRLARKSSDGPAVVHFVSTAHWANWQHGEPTSDVLQVFQQLYPEKKKRLFDVVEFVSRVGGTHTKRVLNLRGDARVPYFAIMRASLCFNCLVLGSGGRECIFAGSWFGETCATSSVALVFLLSAIASALPLLRMSRRHAALVCDSGKVDKVV